jgi:hypothetical protein
VKYLAKSKQNIIDTEDIPNDPEALSKIADIVKKSSVKKLHLWNLTIF